MSAQNNLDKSLNSYSEGLRLQSDCKKTRAVVPPFRKINLNLCDVDMDRHIFQTNGVIKEVFSGHSCILLHYF